MWSFEFVVILLDFNHEKDLWWLRDNTRGWPNRESEGPIWIFCRLGHNWQLLFIRRINKIFWQIFELFWFRETALTVQVIKTIIEEWVTFCGFQPRFCYNLLPVSRKLSQKKDLGDKPPRKKHSGTLIAAKKEWDEAKDSNLEFSMSPSLSNHPNFWCLGSLFSPKM